MLVRIREGSEVKWPGAQHSICTGYLSENFPYLHLVQQLLSSQTEHLDKD